MTTTSSAPPPSRSFPFGKLVLGVLAGFALTLAFGAGALLAYQGQYADRVYPGVSVAGVDVSGLARADAAARLEAELAGYAEGSVVLTVDGTEITLPYAALGRRADVERLVELAWSVGRDHPDPIGRAAQGVRSLLDGTHIDPLVVLDAAAVDRAVTGAALGVNRAPVSASATVTKSRLRRNPASAGRAFPRAEVSPELLDRLADPAAPPPSSSPTTPPRSSRSSPTEVAAAVASANRMARDVVLTHGKETWKLKAATVRGWISFETTTEGYRPTIARSAPRKALAGLAKKIDRAPKDATFLVGRGASVVGVVAARNGRALDVNASAWRSQRPSSIGQPPPASRRRSPWPSGP